MELAIYRGKGNRGKQSASNHVLQQVYKGKQVWGWRGGHTQPGQGKMSEAEAWKLSRGPGNQSWPGKEVAEGQLSKDAGCE